MSELKPCKVCGGKAVMLCVPGCFKTELSSNGWVVKCLKCGCANQMPHISDHDAKEAWNRRVSDDNERD